MSVDASASKGIVTCGLKIFRVCMRSIGLTKSSTFWWEYFVAFHLPEQEICGSLLSLSALMFKCLKCQIRRCGREPSMQVAFFHRGWSKNRTRKWCIDVERKKGTSRKAGEWDSYRTSEHAALWPKLQLLSLPALSKPHRTFLFTHCDGKEQL